MAKPENRAGSARWLTAAMLAAATVTLLVPSASTASPSARPEVSDDEPGGLPEGADRVGELANRLSEAESRLGHLSAQVEVKMEEANKARVDLRRAERSSAEARQAASAASTDATVAARNVEEQRTRLDDFAARSYRQGSKLGSMAAFIGAKSPQDVIDRAEMLDVVSESQLDVLQGLERAQIDKANKDSRARKAVQEAEAKRAAAEEARKQAEAAEGAAVAERAAQAGRTRGLEADKAGVQAKLAEAGVWNGAAGAGQFSPPDASAGVASGSVEVVVRRALSQVGVIYAWGGGDSSGPTQGIRDGGVADSYGDYRKVGFDCSGLMIYAFAGAGVQLDHYSGYQYESGRKVPLSQMRRGDMLFWQDGHSTHHVALYLGNGQMVEAPFSGAQVRVTPVRYDGIAASAVRVL